MWHCGRFNVAEEDEWRKRHEPHGEIINEKYPGVQPPPGSYELWQLRCSEPDCDARLIYMKQEETV